ncbi:hypothetical protein ACFLZP_00545 [Patescibacteria group bacterium]
MDQNTEPVKTRPIQVAHNAVAVVSLPAKDERELLACSKCHQPVNETDYFCHNCGQNLKPAPPPTDISKLILLFVKSALLPPMGIIWGLRYLRQKDKKSKLFGLTAIVITILVLVMAIRFTINFSNTVNEKMNDQFQNLGF